MNDRITAEQLAKAANEAAHIDSAEFCCAWADNLVANGMERDRATQVMATSVKIAAEIEQQVRLTADKHEYAIPLDHLLVCQLACQVLVERFTSYGRTMADVYKDAVQL